MTYFICLSILTILTPFSFYDEFKSSVFFLFITPLSFIIFYPAYLSWRNFSSKRHQEKTQENFMSRLFQFFFYKILIPYLTLALIQAGFLLVLGFINSLNLPAEKIIFITLIFNYLVARTFYYRFSRTAQGISRELVNSGQLQTTLTPPWVGLIAWAVIILFISLSILIFRSFGLIWNIAFIIEFLVGTTIIDKVTPLPSYKMCFNIIESDVEKEIEKNLSIFQTKEVAYFMNLLEEVKSVKNKYVI